MHRSMLIFTVIAISVLFAVGWYRMSPTIKPEDIIITGEVKPNRLSPEPKLPTKEGYVVEMYFEKRTNKPLNISDRAYFYEIYPYIEGFTMAAWDFYKGINANGETIGSEGYYFGSDGRTQQIAANKLKEAGIITERDRQQDLSIGGTDGFTYIGEKFPTKVRLYLTPVDKELTSKKAFLVYSHYESRWGKDLSWAKIVPLKVVYY